MTDPQLTHPPVTSEWYGLASEAPPPPPPAPAAPRTPSPTAGERARGLASRLRRTPRRVVAAFVAVLLAVAVFFGGFTVGRSTAPTGDFNPHHATGGPFADGGPRGPTNR